jgi:uncharacterized protein with HEPN domain
MTRDERDRLRDIKDAILAIHKHLAHTRDTAGVQDAGLLHDALLYQFVVIGEAVKHLSSTTRDATPEVPWANIAGLRDLIAHEYFRINIDQVLEIVQHDLPPLEHAIDRLL